jgi:hypothetical protein
MDQHRFQPMLPPPPPPPQQQEQQQRHQTPTEGSAVHNLAYTINQHHTYARFYRMSLHGSSHYKYRVNDSYHRCHHPHHTTPLILPLLGRHPGHWI